MNTPLSEPYGLRSPLLDHWQRNVEAPVESVEILSPSKTPMRLLTTVELATLRVETCPETVTGLPHSMLGEATIRLRMFEERGLLRHMSGDYLARCLQEVWWPYSHPRYIRRPLRGLELLRLIDLDGDRLGVQVTLSAEPTADDPLHYRRMRLRDRAAELGDVESAKVKRALLPNGEGEPSQTSPARADGS